eukprot:tig00000219_g19514.t1
MTASVDDIAARLCAAPPPPLEIDSGLSTLKAAVAARAVNGATARASPQAGRSPRDRLHRPSPQPSPLSGEIRVTDGFTNFAIAFLAASLVWQAIRNYREYGLLADFKVAAALLDNFWLMCLVWVASVCFSFSVVGVAVAHQRGLLGDVSTVLVYSATQAALFGFDLAFLALGPLDSPLMRGSLAMQMFVLSFKMHSYFMNNLCAPPRPAPSPSLARWISQFLKRDLHLIVIIIHLEQEWRERAARAKAKGGGDGAPGAGGADSADSAASEEAAACQTCDLPPPGWTPTGDVYPSSSGYPSNLTLADFARFLCLPTLVYDERFPLTRRRRWGSVARAALSSFLVLSTMYSLLVHHMLPIMAQASRISLPYLILELSVPSMLFWIAAFFVVFHCGFNAWAEIVGMADRDFYQDWWNATCMQEFWRKWNRPVYKWMCRHVYVESMKTCGRLMTPPLAAVSTMLVTAFLHELELATAFLREASSGAVGRGGGPVVVLTCAIRMVRPWMFAIILVQVPYMYVSSLFKGTAVGNAFVVVGMFVGMPLLWMLYAREVVMASAAAAGCSQC